LISEKKGEDLSNNDNLEYVSFDILNDDAVKVPPVVTNGCFKSNLFVLVFSIYLSVWFTVFCVQKFLVHQ